MNNAATMESERRRQTASNTASDRRTAVHESDTRGGRHEGGRLKTATRAPLCGRRPPDAPAAEASNELVSDGGTATSDKQKSRAGPGSTSNMAAQTSAADGQVIGDVNRIKAFKEQCKHNGQPGNRNPDARE